MSNYEGEKYIRKEIILRNHPLLQFFLADVRDDPEMWGKELAPQFYSTLEIMNQTLGTDTIKFAMTPLYFTAEKLNIFHPSIEREERLIIMYSLITLGYEVGNMSDISLFLDDITCHLVESDVFDESSLTNRSEIKKVVQWVSSLLGTGVIWKNTDPSPKFTDDNSQNMVIYLN